MIKREEGFTMVELMITMVIFVLAIAAASQVFTGLLTQFKQQSKISESNTEGIVGLEMMRRDLAQAGFGLPWNLNGATYSEAINDGGTSWNDTNLNDATSIISNPPAAFRIFQSGGISSAGSSIPNSNADVLAIKSVNVAMNDTSQKWTNIVNGGALPNAIKIWNSANDDLVGTDRIIVLDPGSGTNQNILQKSSTTNFYTTRGEASCTFNSSSTTGSAPCQSFEPAANSFSKFVAYGIAPSGVTPLMPFNRADYYVKRPSANMPSRCAPNTGILYKGVVVNDSGSSDKGKHVEYPILDCVADLKIHFCLDANNDGNIDWPPATNISGTDSSCNPTNDIACVTRRQLKEIRVYIVAQEGQKDMNYDFSQGGTRTSISVNEIVNNSSQTLDSSNFFVDLKTLVGDPEYKYYRWKVYTLVVQPNSMR